MILSEKLLETTLAAGLEGGADFAEVFVEDSRSTRMEYTDSALKKASDARARGAGVRLFYGLEEVYTYTNDLSEAGLVKAARLAAASRPSLGSAGSRTRLKNTTPPNEARGTRPWEANGRDTLELMKRADRAARDAHSAVSQVYVMSMEKNQRVQIANSLGLLASEERNYLDFIPQVFAEGNGARESSFGRYARKEFHDSLLAVNIEAIARRAAKDAVEMLDAEPAPAGEMPVVLASGFGGVIFHEACGHGLETTSVAREASVFCGKLGERVANACVSAYDDGTMPGLWGTLAIDDEGRPTQRTMLIENGILRSYLVDELGSRKTGYTPTGSGRRQSYQFAPTSRMRNTYIGKGAGSLESLIGDVDQGIYCRNFGGGSVTPGTGEYNFAVKEAFLIKKGRIVKPLRGASLIGRGIETLGRIERVGGDLELDAGMCGSSSGWVRTTCGQPPILVSKIQVGGMAQ